jgi:hypothetical protein
LIAGRSLAVLLWAGFAILVAVVLWILLAACGLAWLGGRPMLLFCPVDLAARQVDPALAAEQERQLALQGSIRDLELALLERPYCPIPVPPEPDPQPEPEPQEEPEPIPSPLPDREIEPEPSGEQRAELPPCPARRPTEVVLVLDASNSMGWDFDLDPAVEQRRIDIDERARRLAARFDQLQRSGNILRMMAEAATIQQEQQAIEREYQQLERAVDDPDKVDRIEVAKQALTEVVQASPDDVVFGLVSFNACAAPHRHGHYTPAERDRLLHRLGIIDLDDNTGLAVTLQTLPQIIRGGQSEDDPVNVVLVSDGKDSCRGDPCAAAAALKSAAPHVYVNTIGISRGAEEVRCVADATGGVFVQAEDAQALAQQLVSAAGQDLPEHCR